MASSWPANDVPMAIEWLLQALLTMGLGAFGALMGAIVLWKFWALPKISSWITNEGSTKLRAWMEKVVEDPEGDEAQQIGRLTGVAFSYAIQGLEELASTKEGRERLGPLMEMVQEHIQQSIFATWGHILRKLQESGQGMGGEGFGVPDELMGIGEKLLPKGFKDAGIGLPQVLKIASFLGRFKGGNGSGAQSPLGPGSEAYIIR